MNTLMSPGRLGPGIKYEAIQSFNVACGSDRAYMYQNISIRTVSKMVQRDKKTKKLLYPPNRSVQETELYFRDAQSRWSSSSQCKELTEILESKPHLSVQKVVAFANGPMAVKDDDEQHDRRSDVNASYQHALMLTFKRHFGATECFAQDPAYTDTDIAVLQPYGIKVVDDPEGFLQSDGTTAVISISPNIPVKQVLCDIARPAILIWGRVERQEQIVSDPDSSRVFNIMEHEYDYHDFPPDPNSYIKSYVSVYTKKCTGLSDAQRKL